MAAKILIVDDEESIRYTFTIFLSDEGYEVTTAENFDQAMALILSIPFDLIFVDIIMEGRTGIDLLKEICARGLNVPVVIITGAPSIDTATESLRMGAFDYIIKPVHQDTLLRTVHVALKHKSLINEKEKCRQNFESIFRSVKEGIISLDRNISITEINNSALRICNFQREEVLGKNPSALPLCCQGQCFEALERTFAHRQPQETTYIECHAAHHQNQVVSITTSPIPGSEAELAGAVMLIHDETQLVQLQRSLAMQLHDTKLIGKSDGITKIKSLIRDLADLPTTVLITGESGAGKELVVDSLHRNGERRNQPLVKVNCAALAENLLESELFGHVKGAFTGAIKDKIGRFERADGGIIFLDEIGDISLRMQARLLRVIETMEFEKVGDSTPIKVDVRVVTATNKDLKRLVAGGAFREDLYYRLKVFEIELPPLRNRQDDIPLLANYFLTKYNQKFKKRIRGISSNAWKQLIHYGWPGNVRELQNILEHAFVCCQDEVITTAHLPEDFNKRYREAVHSDLMDEDLGSEAIHQALEKTRWNKSKAADLLGISRRTMYRKMKKYGVSLT